MDTDIVRTDIIKTDIARIDSTRIDSTQADSAKTHTLSQQDEHLVICPGFHDRQLTQHLVQQLTSRLPPSLERSIWVAPMDQVMPTDLWRIQAWLQDLALDQRSTLHLLGFSAGTIATLTLALTWQLQGRPVGAVILCDGWGVPILPTPWRVYRVCHDRWTYDSWQSWGVSTPGFYAEPSVSHLALWGACDQVVGKGQLAQTPMQPYSVLDYWLACLAQNSAKPQTSEADLMVAEDIT